MGYVMLYFVWDSEMIGHEGRKVAMWLQPERRASMQS